jgi:adenylate cyclase
MDEPDRSLLVIVCADVAGYSRLMSEDEEGTFARLQSLMSEIVVPSAQRHQGRIIKTMGDGFLAEFGSAIKAVGFATEIQRRCVETGSILRFRIGIHVGDVITKGGDVFGDGVNIAARLQALAEPGGILVSRPVRDHARDHFPFEDAGEQRLKNIPRPVRTFRVAGERQALARPRGVKISRRWARPILMILAMALSMAAFAVVYYARDPPSVGIQQGNPSIAVFPFANRSGDPSQEYFSDGLAENVLTALSRHPDLFVISRNSTFAYKGKAIDLAEVRRMLGVRYVLEGSVQRAGDQVRVTAHLADTRSSAQVWAERYDRPLQDLFAVQDEIAEKIASRLGTTIQRGEVAAGLQKPPPDLMAYDYYLRGRSLRQANSKEQALEARALFEKAIELDPTFAAALAELAFAHREMALRWDPANREAALTRGLEFADKALAADPTLPMAHMVMGDLLMRRREPDEAVRQLKRAIELNPSGAEYYAGLANILTVIGRSDEAITLMERAFLLDPLHPPNYDMYFGRALLLSQRFEEALPYFHDCSRRAPDYWPCHLFSAITYAYLDQRVAALSAIEDLHRTSQIRSVKDFLGMGDYLPGPALDFMREGLAKAGLPME